ncbi:MAG: hypothetical protein N3D82_02530 [Ignisphaera sp.]|nr:hypothetical protein [Ignisphaera sp.]MCX8167894.1 hypothetical protein [Ignisphaera sp.]MDW8085465.1 hypothetical protein [Ignisphaera sp.]
MSVDSTYIFDIDGVLLDVSQRTAIAERLSNGNSSLFWQYFFSEELLQFDKPRKIGVDTLLDRMGKGAIILLTGRPSRLRKTTLSQLQSIGVPISKIRHIYMRSNSDYRKSCIFKMEIIERILSNGYTILEVHDDDEEFLNRVKRILTHSQLYLHFNDHIIEVSSQQKVLW